MDIETLRTYCLHIPGAEEGQPFGPDFLVYKIMGSMFAMFWLDSPDRVFLKCNPDRALDLRDRYRAVEPAWHMNKKYWNQVWFDRDLPDDVVLRLVRHSVAEVVARWSKKKQAQYAQLTNAR